MSIQGSQASFFGGCPYLIDASDSALDQKQSMDSSAHSAQKPYGLDQQGYVQSSDHQDTSEVGENGYEATFHHSNVVQPYDTALKASAVSEDTSGTSTSSTAWGYDQVLEAHGMQRLGLTYVGKGAFKKVYTQNGRAVQVIDKTNPRVNQALDQFRRVFKEMEQVSSENILKIHQVEEFADRFVLITEYCDQGDLEKYVEENGLSNAQKLALYIQGLEAVEKLHKHGYIHRDIKADNFLVHTGGENGNPQVFLGDFDCITGKDFTNTFTNLFYSPPEHRKRSQPLNTKENDALSSKNKGSNNHSPVNSVPEAVDASYDVWMSALNALILLGETSHEQLPWFNALKTVDRSGVTKEQREEARDEIDRKKMTFKATLNHVANPMLRNVCQRALSPKSQDRGTMRDLIIGLERVQAELAAQEDARKIQASQLPHAS